jgi:ABC-type glycerol-3-phosphate transport system permease component
LLLNIDLPWIGFFRTALVVPMMITPIVAALSWKLLLDPDHGVVNYWIARLQVFATPPLFVWWPTLENYVGVLGQADFLQAFVNSLVVSSGAVILSICVGVPAAYAFARFPFRGGSFLFFSLLVMRMLPPIAVLVPMYILFSKFGLTTTRFSVILAYSTFSLPLVVWIMRGFFEDLPRELEESAWVDGASRYAAFIRSCWPIRRASMPISTGMISCRRFRTWPATKASCSAFRTA